MGSDQKGEGESIARWYRSVRRHQSTRCTRSPAPTPRYDGRSPAKWRIVSRWRHGKVAWDELTDESTSRVWIDCTGQQRRRSL